MHRQTRPTWASGRRGLPVRAARGRREHRESCRRPLAEARTMRRVVVTGLGVVAPNGVGKDAFWSACVNGRSGVQPIRSFDASGHPVKVAAEVPDFDITPYVPPAHRKSLKIMGRAMRYAVAASGLA